MKVEIRTAFSQERKALDNSFPAYHEEILMGRG
jgi:hypothetical protein